MCPPGAHDTAAGRGLYLVSESAMADEGTQTIMAPPTLVVSRPCIVCGRAVPYTVDPLLCEDCHRGPFSNPDSRLAVQGLIDLPAPAGTLLTGGARTEAMRNLSERQRKRYQGMVYTLVSFVVGGAGEVLEEHPDDGRVTIRPHHLDGLPLREQVFFPDGVMYLELRWHRASGRHLLNTINEDPDRPEDTVRLKRLGLAFLEVARTRCPTDGRPVGSGYFAGAAEFREAVVTIIAHEHAAGRPHGQKEVAAILNRQFRDQGRKGFTGGDLQVRKWIGKYGPPGGWPQLQREGEARAAEFRGY